MKAMAAPSRGGADESDNGNQDKMNRRKESAKNRNRSPCAPCQNSKQKCERGTPCLRCTRRGEPNLCLPGRKGRRNTVAQFIDETSRYSSEASHGPARQRATGPTFRGRRGATSISTGFGPASPAFPQPQPFTGAISDTEARVVYDEPESMTIDGSSSVQTVTSGGPAIGAAQPPFGSEALRDTVTGGQTSPMQLASQQEQWSFDRPIEAVDSSHEFNFRDVLASPVGGYNGMRQPYAMWFNEFDGLPALFD